MLALAIALEVVGGCSRGGTDEGVRISGTTRPPASVTSVVPTTAAPANGTLGPQVSTLEADSPVECQGETAAVAVRYTTTDSTSVAFLVDNTPVPGNPPLSGSFDVALSCDGNAHTVILVANGPSGQTFATKAVLTDRQD